MTKTHRKLSAHYTDSSITVKVALTVTPLEFYTSNSQETHAIPSSSYPRAYKCNKAQPNSIETQSGDLTSSASKTKAPPLVHRNLTLRRNSSLHLHLTLDNLQRMLGILACQWSTFHCPCCTDSPNRHTFGREECEACCALLLPHRRRHNYSSLNCQLIWIFYPCKNHPPSPKGTIPLLDI